MSVYRTSKLSAKDVWAIGLSFVEALRTDGKKIVGGVQIPYNEIQRQNLNLLPTYMPHPRHANIVDWPTTEAEIKSVKAALALAATKINKP